jgi:hypothetical protein
MAILLRQGFGEQDGEWRTSGFHVLLSGDLQQADGKKNVNFRRSRPAFRGAFSAKDRRNRQQPTRDIAFNILILKLANILQ